MTALPGQSWEYTHTWITRRVDDADLYGLVEESMRKYAAKGWELASANAIPYPLVYGGQVMQAPIDTTIYVRYTMFWRRPVDSSA